VLELRRPKPARAKSAGANIVPGRSRRPEKEKAS
jgi:hypothetical protein